MSNDFLIETTGLSFSYNGARLLDNLDFRLRNASLGALIGANGSGKSTLMKLLCGLLRPVSGSIKFHGESLDSISRNSLAQKMAYVAQSISLTFPFTSLEIVLTGRNPYLNRFGMETKEDLRLAMDALKMVGVAHLAERAITVLSGGERQLVLVARAIAQSPSLLLLDEPAGFLDLKHRAQLVQVLRRLRDERGIASLVVTHDLMFLEPSFDRVYALGEGRIMAEGTPREVLVSATLQEVYGVGIHTMSEEGKIFVWSEV
jgi:iron complex transport system ATP-binding protein